MQIFIMNGNSQSDDSVREEEEDELEIQNKLEESFMNLCIEQKQKDLNQPKFKVQLPNSKEMMFILFSFYQEDLMSIGLDFSCRVRLSLNKIKITSEVSQDNVDNCLAKIRQYLQKLSYTELNHDNKYKLLHSPYFKQKAELKGFRFCKFNEIVYCHSNKMNEKALLSSMKDLFSGQYLFTVTLKTRKSKDREIYTYLRDFIKKMKEYYLKETSDRGVIVELDHTETLINCIGNKPRDLVAVKNIFKNLLEATVILIIRYENQEQIDKKVHQFKSYLKKKSSFPVTAAKVQKRVLTIISKQNVVRKLFEAPKTLQILKIDDKTELGMFLPRRYNFLQRKIMIQQICTKKGYDFTTLGGIYHFFKKMFSHEDQQVDPKQVLSLIHQILQAIKENKEKYEIPEQIRTQIQERRQLQVTDGQFYYAGEIIPDAQISKILKRDVLKQKLKMSKPALVRYRICEAAESDTIYWFVNKENKKIICQIADMKAGTEYFCGKVKKLGQEENYFIEFKIIIL